MVPPFDEGLDDFRVDSRTRTQSNTVSGTHTFADRYDNVAREFKVPVRTEPERVRELRHRKKRRSSTNTTNIDFSSS